LTTENWKTIEGFEAYEVSDLGRVRRRLPGQHTQVGHILKPGTSKGGYLKVDLCNNGTHTKKVHKLVATAFVPNPLNLPQVNHTGKKSDNRACKLEWVTTKEHGRDKARRKQTSGDGIRFHKVNNQWSASYCPEPRKRKHIGYFDTFKEAKTARDAKIKTI
jgi:hypothetical protein